MKTLFGFSAFALALTAAPALAAIDLGLCPAVQTALDPNGGGDYADGDNTAALAAAIKCVDQDKGRGLISQAYVLRRLDRSAEALTAVNAGLAAGGDPVAGNRVLCALKGDVGDLDGAREACKAAVKAGPNRALGYYGLGQLEYVAQKWEAALSAYDAALARGAEDFDIFLRRGNVLTALGRNDDALASFKRAVPLAPKSADPHVEMARTLNTLGRNEEAIVEADAALRLDPKSAGAHRWRGRALEALSRYQDAFTDYDAAVKLDPKWADLAWERGTMQEKLGHHNQAFEDYSLAIQVNPKLAVAYSYRAALLASIDRSEDAEADLTRAIGLEPKVAQYWSQRGALYMSLRRNDDAARDIDRTLALDPQFYPALSNRGSLRFKKGDFPGAVEDYSAALRGEPNMQPALFWRARAYAELKNVPAAIADYTELLKVNSDYLWAYYNRGVLLSDTQNCEAALKDFATVIRRMPGRGYPWTYSAYCAGMKPGSGAGWWDENQALYDAAPSSADKYLAAVLLATSLHQAGVANGMMAKAMAIAPSDPLVLSMKKDLQGLGKNRVDRLLGDLDDLSAPRE